MSNQVPQMQDKIAERFLRELLDRVIKLEQKLSASVGTPKQTTGDLGATRVVKRADGTTELQVRSKDGWHSTGALDFQEKEQ